MRSNKYSQSLYRPRPPVGDSGGTLGPQNPVRHLPLFLFLLAMSLGAMAVDVRYGFDWLTHFTGRLSDPLVLGLDAVVQPVSSSFDYVRETLAARGENKSLRERVTELEKENLALEQASEENERLRDLLNLKAEVAPSAMAAEVVRYVDLPGKRMMVLRAGEDQGLQVGQPVLSYSNQLLGRVIELSPSAATVRLIHDPVSKVRVTVERTGAQGTLYSHSGNLYIRLERGESIRDGDRIVTSHLSTAYPEGLAVGEISEEATAPESDPMVAVEMGLMKSYRVRGIVPLARWNSFREVLCLPGSHQTLLEQGEGE